MRAIVALIFVVQCCFSMINDSIVQRGSFELGKADSALMQIKVPSTNPTGQFKSEFQQFAEMLGYQQKIYGHEFLNSRDQSGLEIALVSPNYTIGPGDEIEISIWGSIVKKYRVVVSRAGNIDLGGAGVVGVTNIQFGDLDNYLKSHFSNYYKNFDIKTAMSRLRRVQVYMVGTVRSPGIFSIQAPATISQLLVSSQNISEMSSLREIQIIRNKELVGTFDLYDFLHHGEVAQNHTLIDGDVIKLVPVKTQVLLNNNVIRPGIYELAEGETLIDIIEIFGGKVNSMKDVNITQEYVDKDNQGKIITHDLNKTTIGDINLEYSSIISINSSPKIIENAITIQGNVFQPGRVEFNEGMTIYDVLSQNKKMLFSKDFLREFQNTHTINSDILSIMKKKTTINWEYALLERFNFETQQTQFIPFNLGKVIFEKNVNENQNLMPGDKITIFNMVDISSPLHGKPIVVTVKGEVNRVGTFQMQAGDTFYDLMEKVNGVTEKSYLFGMKYYRTSVKRQQDLNYKKLLFEMERQIENQISSELSTVSGEEQVEIVGAQSQGAREWLQRLKSFKPDGRIVFDIEPSTDLKVEDFKNFELEDGDVVEIPSKPSFVSVFGEVSVQSAFLYQIDEDVGDYLTKAGGLTRYSDDDQVFVLRADGSVVSEQDYGFLFWQLESLDSMPGDVIFVPKNLEYSRWIPLAKDLTQILANMGVAIASIIILTK